VLSQVKGALVLDAGNSLFRATGLTDQSARTRAAFILKQLGALGTQAMAPGQRDLNLGAAFLTSQAKAAGAKLLSANLRQGEAPLYEAAAIFTVGGAKVAVIGVSPEGPLGELTGAPALPAVEKALEQVKGADVRVVLAALPYDVSLKLSQALGAKVDFVIQSDGGRGTVSPQLVKDNYLFASGLRGQAVGRLDVKVDGAGPLVDEAGTGRAIEQLAFLDRQLQVLDERIARTLGASGKKALQQTAAELRRRRADVQKEAAATKVKGARTFRFEWQILDKRIEDDPAMKARVLKIEPTYRGPP